SADLLARATSPSPCHPLGPFRWPILLDRFAALAAGSRDALADRWPPPDALTFDKGYAQLRAAHPELSRAGRSDDGDRDDGDDNHADDDNHGDDDHGNYNRDDGLTPSARLLRLGTRFWREGRRDRSPEVADDANAGPLSADDVQAALERLILRAA